MRRALRRHRGSAVLALALLLGAIQANTAISSGAAVSGSLRGTAFADANKNGVPEAGEERLAAQQLYLFDSAGAFVAATQTDDAGRYAFEAVHPGTYRVAYAAPSWWALREDWVPTTTESVRPSITVFVDGTATADFGWRRIARSRDLSAPLSSFRGTNGLLVESFNDAVHARDVFDAIMAGAVGAEAQYVTVRFDYSSSASTVAAWQGVPGSFSGYNAVSYVNWISWLESGDQGLSHEYGHAWSLYYDTIVQQDGTLRAYLVARGLAGDERVNTSYAWSARELIAEDYRQLLGSPNARLAAQLNRELPLAAEVPGLYDFLVSTFVQPTVPAPAPEPAPQLETELEPLAVSVPSVSPTPVSKFATISSSISADAVVAVVIRNAKGAVVRTLLGGAERAAGDVTVTWDRKDSSGRRVKGGTYRVDVSATAPDGAAANAEASFRVV